MDVYFLSPLLQFFTLLFVVLFAFASRRRPFFAFRLFPITLPFYLVKLYFRPQEIEKALQAKNFLKAANSFFFPEYTEYPVIPPDLREMSSLTIPTNLLEVLIVVFLVINWKFLLRGMKMLIFVSRPPVPKERFGKKFESLSPAKTLSEFSSGSTQTKGNKQKNLGKCLLVAGCCLLFVALLSSFFALNLRVSFGATKSLFILPFLLFLTALPFLSRERLREKFLDSIALSGIVLVLINLPFLLEGLLTYDHRLAGVFLSPNHLGMAIAPGILAIVVLLLSKRNIASEEKMRDNGQWKMQNAKLWSRLGRPLINCRGATPEFFFLLFAFLILFATTSYGTWISLLGALFFLLFLYRGNVAQDKYNPQPLFRLWQRPTNEGGQKSYQKSKFGIQNSKFFLARKLSLTFLFVVVSIALFLSQYNNPKLEHILNGDYYSSFHSRLMIWRSALTIFKDYWLLGVGPGNFQQAYLNYATKFNEPYLEWSAPMPHNIFLAFLVQLGVLGLLSFLLILAFTFYHTLHYIFILCGAERRRRISLKKCSLKRTAHPASTNSALKGPIRLQSLAATPARGEKMPISHHAQLNVVQAIFASLASNDSLSLFCFSYFVYFLLHGLVDTPYFKNDLAIVFWLVLAGMWKMGENSKLQDANSLPIGRQACLPAGKQTISKSQTTNKKIVWNLEIEPTLQTFKNLYSDLKPGK